MSKKQDMDIPGNAFGSVQKHAGNDLKIFTAIKQLGMAIAQSVDSPFAFKGMKIKSPQYPGGDFFVIVQVEVDGVAMVGFHSAGSLEGLLSSLKGKLANGKIKLQEDKYANTD